MTESNSKRICNDQIWKDNGTIPYCKFKLRYHVFAIEAFFMSLKPSKSLAVWFVYMSLYPFLSLISQVLDSNKPK